MRKRNLDIARELEKHLFGQDSLMSKVLEPVKGKTAIDYWAYEKLIKEGRHLPDDIIVTPTYMTEKAVGCDAFASEEVIIEPWTVKAVMTGFKAKFPGDELGLFAAIRSNIPKKKGLILANGLGVIEEDYYENPDNDGNVGFLFLNYTNKPVKIERFERLGQLFLANIDRFENAGRAGKKRGESGSTGK